MPSKPKPSEQPVPAPAAVAAPPITAAHPAVEQPVAPVIEAPQFESLPMKLRRFTPPQVGMPVQYTVTDGQTPGAIRAGIITAVFHQPGWETDPDKVCWEVSLTLFPPQNNLSLHEEAHPPRVPYNEDPTARRSWRFIGDADCDDEPES
jgi:hypothetical protein